MACRRWLAADQRIEVGGNRVTVEVKVWIRTTCKDVFSKRLAVPPSSTTGLGSAAASLHGGQLGKPILAGVLSKHAFRVADGHPFARPTPGDLHLRGG